MSAGDVTAVYRGGRGGGDGAVGNFITRAVLRELCRISHDAGIVHVRAALLTHRLGIDGSHLTRALARLLADGWIARPVKGVGNRQGTASRASVYVLRPLPDDDGVLAPEPEWVGQQWPKYAGSNRYLDLSKAARAAVRLAAQAALMPLSDPVDNGQQVRTGEDLLGLNKSAPLPQQVRTHEPLITSKTIKNRPDQGQEHPAVAERRRHQVQLAKAGWTPPEDDKFW